MRWLLLSSALLISVNVLTRRDEVGDWHVLLISNFRSSMGFCVLSIPSERPTVYIYRPTDFLFSQITSNNESENWYLEVSSWDSSFHFIPFLNFKDYLKFDKEERLLVGWCFMRGRFQDGKLSFFNFKDSRSNDIVFWRCSLEDSWSLSVFCVQRYWSTAVRGEVGAIGHPFVVFKSEKCANFKAIGIISIIKYYFVILLFLRYLW